MLMVVTHRREQIRQVMVMQPVVGATPLPTDHHETQLAQQAQLMRNGALLHADDRCQLLDGPLCAEQRPKQLQATRRPERAHRLGQKLRLLAAQRSVGRAMFGRVSHDRKIHL